MQRKRSCRTSSPPDGRFCTLPETVTMRALMAVAAALGVALLSSGPAGARRAPPSAQVRAHPQLGDVLVDGRGMTLYVSTRNAPDASACSGPCSQVWTPLFAGSASRCRARACASTRRARAAGWRRQVTYAGRPLYGSARTRARATRTARDSTACGSCPPSFTHHAAVAGRQRGARPGRRADPHRRARADAAIDTRKIDKGSAPARPVRPELAAADDHRPRTCTRAWAA